MPESQTFEWPVEYKAPSGTQPGKFSCGEFTVTFRRLPPRLLSLILRLEAEAAIARMANPDAAIADPRLVQLMREIIVGWQGVVDAAGAPLVFNAENLDRLLTYAGMLSALLTAYCAGVAAGRNDSAAPSRAPQLH